MHGQKLEEESAAKLNVLRDLVVGHGLAELVDLLQDELTYFADRLDFQLVECVVDIVEAFYFLGWFLVQEIDLVVEFVQVFEEWALGYLTVQERSIFKVMC